MEYPLLATRGIITFPDNSSKIEVGRTKSINAVKKAIASKDGKLIVVSQKSAIVNDITDEKQIYSVGTLSKVRILQNYQNGAIKVEINGISRFKISKVTIQKDIINSQGTILKSIKGNANEERALVNKLTAELENTLGTNIKIPAQLLQQLSDGMSANELTDILGHYLQVNIDKKSSLLIEKNINKRLQLLLEFLRQESQINDIEKELDQNVRTTLDSQQKEFLLRERLKAIKEELGELSSKDSEIDNIRDKLAKGEHYPKHVKEKINEELKKFEAMPPISAEAHVTKGYIDWLIKLPWNTYSKDSQDIKKARDVLNKHHYGLEKVKDRIIEHLAVKTNTNSSTSPILTLVGPPGVGKTSLAKSIAEAVGREFIKISLGGVKDEAQIRGHRKTYVGSMPGNIINGLAKAKTSNPIILLDEIDKMSSDYKGDPTSAMLEVLDPEQNKHYQDHFLEIDYDLSKVMFFATANYYENIPSPLLDRVELIELSSYTMAEKLEIAKTYLVSKVLKNNGLKKSEFKITSKLIEFIIKHYTMEAGVRGLTRKLDKLARKIVVKKITNSLPSGFKLDEENIKSMLGRMMKEDEGLEKTPSIGAVTALAWTSVGGSAFPIEVNTYKTKGGGLKLTGQLKEVMQESANIALGYVRANAERYNIDFDFDNNTIQIHVPKGSIPKDGPSAGVTFTTSIISALTKKTISQKVAMTGELTLRGKVLEIGGLKEKAIAASKIGISKIFIPNANAEDVKDIPKEVTKNVKFIPVINYDEIYKELFN